MPQPSAEKPIPRIPTLAGLLWRRVALGVGAGLGATVVLVLAVGFVHGQSTLASVRSEAGFFETVGLGIAKLAGRTEYFPGLVGLVGSLGAAILSFAGSNKSLESKLNEALDLVYQRLESASGREREAFLHGLGMLQLYQRALASERTVLRLVGLGAAVIAAVALAFETAAAYVAGIGVGLAALGVAIVLTLPNEQVKVDVERFLRDMKHGVKGVAR